MEIENQICTYLKDKSNDLKKKFTLLELLQTSEENQNHSMPDIIHEELQIDDDNDCKYSYQNSVNINNINFEISKETLQNDCTTISEVDVSLRDPLLDELDTAILSCQNNVSHNKPEQGLEKMEQFPDNLNDLIEEISDPTIEITAKPYNTRNKRKRILDSEDDPDDINHDPDFRVDDISVEEDSDEDYIEGSENFGWIAKSR